MMGNTRTHQAIRAGVLAIAVVGSFAVLPAAAAQAAGVSGTARTEGGPLNIRAGASTNTKKVGQIRNGGAINLQCYVTGQSIRGMVRTTTAWNRISAGRYVSDAYVKRSTSVPKCDSGPKPATATATVRSPGTPLNVRAGASTVHKRLGQLTNGTRVTVQCQVTGDSIRGSARTTAAWIRIGTGRYVTDAYLTWRPSRPAVPWCSAPRDAAPTTHAAFITWAAKHAQQGRKLYGVPVSVTIAQAIHESGWGRSGLSTQGNAYFGIKCFGTPGPIAIGCRPYDTHECDDEDCYATRAAFRIYPKAAESFRDHGRFLTVNTRYKPAFAHKNNPDRFIQEVHRAGYATSPTYSKNIIALMKQYNLYKYDK